jgi:hypothetical protein
MAGSTETRDMNGDQVPQVQRGREADMLRRLTCRLSHGMCGTMDCMTSAARTSSGSAPCARASKRRGGSARSRRRSSRSSPTAAAGGGWELRAPGRVVALWRTSGGGTGVDCPPKTPGVVLVWPGSACHTRCRDKPSNWKLEQRLVPFHAPGNNALQHATPRRRHHLMYNESLELTAPQHTAVKT